MGVMPIIILLSLVVAGGFAIAFVVAAQRGQYDDVQTPSMRMLFDDETSQPTVKPSVRTDNLN
ncbi:MAG: cbb3-type cytochrome oxidase assembly protein CcoS [Candidatus Kapabacteria bacterium]|nr:cbb3-type cytochrome oxidase assembly protein CcoS [Candidatus Kapabacteria bacterium]